jgi:amino acid adenylation domain-containing protein
VFERTLEAVTAEPSCPIGRLDLLTDDQRSAILHWNATSVDRPSWHSVQHEIARSALRRPTSIALTYEGAHVTYASLDADARRIASCLLQNGVVAEEPVGILLDRGPDLIAAILGVLYAGACYVPLEPTLPDLRLRRMIETAGVRKVITTVHCAARRALEGVDTIDFATDPSGARPTSELPVRVDPRNLAYVLFTSGSTGLPKGVMVEHQALANRLDWMIAAFGIAESDCILHKTPIGFDVSLWEIFAPLLVGARMVIAKPEGHRDARYIAALLSRHEVTIVHFVPSMLQAFLEQEELPIVPALRHAVCSGEALRTALYHRATAWLGDERKIVNLYGPTEATIDVSVWTNAGRRPGVAVSIGRPIQNLRLYVLDPLMRNLPIGAAGELYIGGVGLARGYVGAPDLTADWFVPDPFAAGERLYRTGDCARWTVSGEIEFLGRIDTQVKLRGMRVELGEIEEILRQNPMIDDAAVSMTGADGKERLVAHVVPARCAHAALHGALRLAREANAEGLRCRVLPNGRVIIAVPDCDGVIVATERALALRQGCMPPISAGATVVDVGEGGGLFGMCVAALQPGGAVVGVGQDHDAAHREAAMPAA